MTFWTRDAKALLLLLALVLATTLPFIHRAYFVDDYYHMLMAKGLLSHPLRPYDFKSDDAGIGNVGWERGQRPRMVNPPLFHFCMAGAMLFVGDAVWKLRAFSLIFSLVALACTYFLGKRIVRRPLAATVLMALTPAYWLTSYSLLIDSGLIAFFMLALLLFVRAQEKKSLVEALVSGFLMGLTILVKYFGVLIVPLAFVWQVLDPDRRRWEGGYTAYIVCAVVQLCWGIWNILTYGQTHFFATLPRGFHSSSWMGIGTLLLMGGMLVSRRQLTWGTKRISSGWLFSMLLAILLVGSLTAHSSISAWVQSLYLDKIFVLGSFLSGCTGFLLLAPFWLVTRDAKSLVIIGVFCALLFLAFHSRSGGFDGSQSALMSGLIGATAAFIVLVSQRATISSDPVDRFLMIWLGLGLLELIGIMPWTAGRYLLLIIPCLVWLFFRWMEQERKSGTELVALLCTLILGLSMAYADYAQANTIIKLAGFLSSNAPRFELLAPQPLHHWYYQADTFDGSQPYIIPLGWQNVLPDQTFQPGDLFLRSRYRKSGWWTVREERTLRPVTAFVIPSAFPLRVMDVPDSAGFYASCWGALPFAITRHPLESFELYQRQ